MKRILVVDDDRNIRHFVRLFATKAGYAVAEAGDGDEALALHTADPADLAVVDIFMPNKDGLETIRALRLCAPLCKVIAISGGYTALTTKLEFLEHAQTLGADSILPKPLDKNLLIEAISALIGPA